MHHHMLLNSFVDVGGRWARLEMFTLLKFISHIETTINSSSVLMQRIY